MKNIFFIITVFLIFVFPIFVFAFFDTTLITKDISAISTIQLNYNSPTDDYKKYEEIGVKTIDGISRKVDEYVVWSGGKIPFETGYIITYTKPDGTTMATGTGEYAKTISHDWTAILKLTSSTTKEIK